LEQVFLRLLVHAEQSLAAAPEKVLTIRTSLLARMVVVEIVFSARAEAHNAGEVAAILGVTRSVIAGHGGEVRLMEKSHGDARFEVELPILAKDRGVAADPSAQERTFQSGRRMTALIIETEDAAQRQVLALLAARGYRVVPVDNTDTGLDLAQRMRFDVVFCSVRAPGLNWVELAERMQSKVTGFVLLSDGYDAELAANFEGDGRFVLAKPVQDSELQKVLGAIERPIPA
jgi:CheY-like chemotaxis protein